MCTIFEFSWRYVRVEDEDYKTAIDKLLSGKYINNTRLFEAIESGHEIMIHCQQVIIVAAHYVKYLQDNY